MMIRKEIIIPSARDKKYGYLSNSYNKDFILEGKVWSTVEHYYFAKLFGDTQFSETIRNTSSIAALRNLLLNCKKDGIVHLSEDVWYDMEYDVLKSAIHTKFNTHPHLLKKLHCLSGIDIIEKKYILSRDKTLLKLQKNKNKITQELLEELALTKDVVPDIDLSKDIKDSSLSESEKSIVIAIVTTAKNVASCEQSKTMYPEMFEDAIYNVILSNVEEALDIVSRIHEYSTTIKKWSDITPKFAKLVENIGLILSDVNTGKYTIDVTNILFALICGIFIKYVRYTPTLGEVIQAVPKEKVCIPKIKRSYRCFKPPSISKDEHRKEKVRSLNDKVGRMSLYIRIGKMCGMSDKDVDEFSKKMETYDEKKRDIIISSLNDIKEELLVNNESFKTNYRESLNRLFL